MAAIRLQRLLAEAGVASRRGADALIAAGRVSVDGHAAVIGERVDPMAQRVEVDGEPLAGPQQLVYLVLSKPRGVTSTVADPHAGRTVLDLVPPSLSVEARLYPVGRLDRDSEGLLILTNDGALTERLLHPRYGVEREYAVAIAEPLDPQVEARLREGVELSDGPAAVRTIRRSTAAETASLAPLLSPPLPARPSWYRVTLAEGRKREIRRMFTAVGAPVQRLIRVRFGPLTLDGLRPGQVRRLSGAEVARLQARGPQQGGHRLVVALDGPGGSGKSTVGSAAAGYLGYRFCDTGMFYRAVTWLALRRGVDSEDGPALAALVPDVQLADEAEGRLSRVLVEGRDVTGKVASQRVDRHVSAVARQAEVRTALLPRQRELAEGGGIVMAGRDIGTVVLPDADLKLFLDASASERAQRRAEQRGVEPDSATAHRILTDLERRDAIDANRPVAPLRVAPGAVVIRTDGNTLGQTIDAVVAAIRRREREVQRGPRPKRSRR